MNERCVEHNFTAFEPMLWRVLSSLTRHGFVASPMDARDVIHDFYLDGWSGVTEHFDSELGSFTTYLASAFYKFARRRIVALQSWRQRHVDVDLLAEHPSEDETPLQIVEHREQLAAIRSALARLPSEERGVLLDYLSESEPSEREIAARHSLTRYALRERLLNAVGRVAVEMGSLNANSPESLVAFYLWHDGRSPKNVSSLLGISVSDVHSLKSQFAAHLLASIRSVSPPRLQGVTIMPPILELFKAALLREGDLKALAALQGRAEDLREAFNSDDTDLELSPDERIILDAHPEWLANVYEAVLVGPLAETAENSVELAIAQLRTNEEAEIGEAFVALLQTLPGEFHSWRDFFGKLTPVSLEEQAYLRSDPSYVENTPEPEGLAYFGLTPLMFYDAVRGLELLFDRVLEQGAELQSSEHADGKWPRLVLTLGEFQVEPPRSLLVSQFGTTPGLRPDAREYLAAWVFEALQLCPQLVRGYEAHSRRGYIEVIQLQAAADRAPSAYDLVRRWSLVDGASSIHR